MGQGSKVDYYSAQVDYNEDKALLIAQEQSFTNTKIGFNTILIKDYKSDFQINTNIDILPKLKLGELKMSALSQNPNLISAILSKKISWWLLKICSQKK